MNAESLSVKRIKTCKQKCCGTALLLSVFMLIQPAYAGNKNVHAPARLDFDGDGKSDIGCYDPNTGDWFVFRSTEGFTSMNCGSARTLPVAEDFDGDGFCDYGTYYAPNGEWRIMKSKQGGMTNHFGYAGTVPLTGDFDGDGICDFGCYYAASGAWYIYKSRDGFWANNFGYEGTVPVTGDFDGDGTCDFGCYYPPSGSWYIYKSRDGFWANNFGYEGTIPVTGNFDGDGICDFGCYYPPEGVWYFYRSQDGFQSIFFGFPGTVPVTGDFTGDGVDNIGVYYAPNGAWYTLVPPINSTAPFSLTYFGYEGTLPIGCIPAVQRVTLSLSAIPADKGSVSGAGTYFMGEQVQIAAQAGSGWRFVSWGGSNKDTQRSICVLSNMEMKAYFSLNGCKHALEFYEGTAGALNSGGLQGGAQYINAQIRVGDTFVNSVGAVCRIIDVDAYDEASSTWIVGDGNLSSSRTKLSFYDTDTGQYLRIYIGY